MYSTRYCRRCCKTLGVDTTSAKVGYCFVCAAFIEEDMKGQVSRWEARLARLKNPGSELYARTSACLSRAQGNLRALREKMAQAGY